MTNEISKAATAFGRMGGKATVKKHGKDHMKNLANKRWAKKTPPVDNAEKP